MADTFDPQAFLSEHPPPPEGGGAGFDPQAFLKEHPPPSETPDVLPDVAKSAGIGVLKGSIGLAGMPGDIREATAGLINRGSKALGYEIPQETASGVMRYIPLPGAAGPTSGQLRGAVESATGPLYEPKTMAGQYAQTAGEFLPAAIGGPETMAAKLASRVAIPAIASETAGQLTKGTAFEPYARIAGGAGAGVLAATRRAGFTAPSIDRLEQAARENYQHPDVTSLGIDPSSLSRLAQTTWADLYQSGFRQDGIPRVIARLGELARPNSPTGQPVAIARVADVDSVRRGLNKIAGNFSNPEEQEAARRAIRSLDDYLGGNIPPTDVVQGNVARANALLQDARQNWSAARHGQTLIDKLDQADLRAASTYSGGNLDNAIRQNVRKILDSPKLRRGYTDEQLDQMERIVRGTAIGNTARRFGKIGGGGGGLGTLAAAAVGEHALGPVGYALPLVGNAARRIGEASTARQAEMLNQAIRASSPEGRAAQAIYNRVTPPALSARSAALARTPFYAQPLELPPVDVTGERAAGGKVSNTKRGKNAPYARQIGVRRKFPMHVGGQDGTENDSLQDSPTHGGRVAPTEPHAQVEQSFVKDANGEFHLVPDEERLDAPPHAKGGRVAVPNVKIVRKWDVPYLSGASNDGKSVYIDRRVPLRIKVKLASGKGFRYIDPARPLSIHETKEWKAMQGGIPYLKAHKTIATPAEHAWLTSHGLDWRHYEEVMGGLLDHIEHEHPKRPPPDLYLKPYCRKEHKLLAREEKQQAA